MRFGQDRVSAALDRFSARMDIDVYFMCRTAYWYRCVDKIQPLDRAITLDTDSDYIYVVLVTHYSGTRYT